MCTGIDDHVVSRAEEGAECESDGLIARGEGDCCGQAQEGGDVVFQDMNGFGQALTRCGPGRHKAVLPESAQCSRPDSRVKGETQVILESEVQAKARPQFGISMRLALRLWPGDQAQQSFGSSKVDPVRRGGGGRKTRRDGPEH